MIARTTYTGETIAKNNVRPREVSMIITGNRTAGSSCSGYFRFGLLQIFFFVIILRIRSRLGDGGGRRRSLCFRQCSFGSQ